MPGSGLGTVGTAAGSEAAAVSVVSVFNLGLRRGTFLATDTIDASLDVLADEEELAEYFILVSDRVAANFMGPILPLVRAGPPLTAMPTCCKVVW